MIIGAFALVVGLTLYTLLDALRTHQDQMRTFPKWLWIIAVIFFPVVGPLLWLLLGRPRAVVRGSGARILFAGTSLTVGLRLEPAQVLFIVVG